jgi:hypothetical protein
MVCWAWAVCRPPCEAATVITQAAPTSSARHAVAVTVIDLAPTLFTMTSSLRCPMVQEGIPSGWSQQTRAVRAVTAARSVK